MRRHRPLFVAALGLAAVVFGLAGPAAAQEVIAVGTSKDACDGDDTVRITGKDQTHRVRARQERTIDLATTRREMTWHCGDSKERVANDEPFNRVRIEREANGAIRWRFYYVKGAGGPGNVGTTKDACDRSEVVKIADRSGETVRIKAGQKNQVVDLPAATREVTWYCGGTRERAANDEPFNRVRLSRADNGALSWTFVMAPRDDPAEGAGLVRVGESFDACDASEPVLMRDNAIRVGAPAMRHIGFDHPVRSFRFFCGDTPERVTNPNPFNVALIERAGNGAIHWVFYRRTAVSGDNLGDFLHNVAGDIEAGTAAVGGRPAANLPPMAGRLKEILDDVWNDARADVEQIFRDEMREEEDTQLDRLTLSRANAGELRVLRRPNGGVTVKYVVHENTADVSLIRGDPVADINVNLTFDIELALVFPATQSSAGLAVTRATAFARHVEVSGADPWGHLMVELGRTFVRRKETSLGTKTREITEDINQRLGAVRDQILAQVGGAIPPGLDTLQLDAAPDGALLLCLTRATEGSPLPACSFPSRTARDLERRVLDRSRDQCGDSRVWLWDHEKGRFVSVPRGGSTVVELDSHRLEWFCGGPSEPDTDRDEWATAPVRTYGVRVTRPEGGGRIEWEFLHWRPQVTLRPLPRD